MIPENMLPKLETELMGASLNRGELSQRLEQFYERTKVQAPGVMPDDFVGHNEGRGSLAWLK